MDTRPTQDGARASAQTLLVEGEVAYHAGDAGKPTPKVKQLGGLEKVEGWEKVEGEVWPGLSR